MLVIDLLVRVRVLFPMANQNALSEFVKQFAVEFFLFFMTPLLLLDSCRC